MRLTRAMGGWALVDDHRRQLAAIAGGLSAWAPRLVGGEGLHVLPMVGRYEAFHALEPIETERWLGRMFWSTTANGVTGLAAVLGAGVRYRPDPVRCVLGYIHVTNLAGPGPVRLGPVLIGAATLDAVAAVEDAAIAARLDLGAHLTRLDALHTLRTGDMVLLDAPQLSEAQRQLLTADDIRSAAVAPSVAVAGRAICA